MADGLMADPEPVQGYYVKMAFLLSWLVGTPTCRGAFLCLTADPEGDYQEFPSLLASRASQSADESMQEAVLTIVQSLLDTEVAFQTRSGTTPRPVFPAKRHMSSYLSIAVDNLKKQDGSEAATFAAIRTLELSSCHDYGVHALKHLLRGSDGREGRERPGNAMRTFLERTIETLDSAQPDAVNSLPPLVQLLRLVTGLDLPPDRTKPCFSPIECFGQKDVALVLLNTLQSKVKNLPGSEEYQEQLMSVNEQLSELISHVQNSSAAAAVSSDPAATQAVGGDESELNKSGAAEPEIEDSPEALVEQFKCRQLFTVVPPDQDPGESEQMIQDHFSFDWQSGDVIVTDDVTTESDVQLCKPVDLLLVADKYLTSEFDVASHVRRVCDEKSLETDVQKKKKPKKSLLEAKALQNKNLISSFKAGAHVPMRTSRGFHRTSGQRLDAFRSRPANTSRPPSLHVDDFLLLQMRGQQPTGPTGYNKQSVKAAQELYAEREAKSKGALVGFRFGSAISANYLQV